MFNFIPSRMSCVYVRSYLGRWCLLLFTSLNVCVVFYTSKMRSPKVFFRVPISLFFVLSCSGLDWVHWRTWHNYGKDYFSASVRPTDNNKWVRCLLALLACMWMKKREREFVTERVFENERLGERQRERDGLREREREGGREWRTQDRWSNEKKTSEKREWDKDWTSVWASKREREFICESVRVRVCMCICK